MNSETVRKKELESILHGPAALLNESASTEATLVADTKCILGECVLYDDLHSTILWTDIDGKVLYKLSLDNGELLVLKLPKLLGAFCLTNKPATILCGWEDGFQFYSISTQQPLSEYSQGPIVNPKGLPSRLNDGRCDPSGSRFVCGGFFGGEDKSVKVQVYSCRLKDDSSTQLVHEPILDNVQITNSLCFSPDGSTMYFCDSLTRVIQQYDYDTANGKPTFNRNVWTVPKDLEGFPDGSCVDEEGYIWSAFWRAGTGPGRIHRIHPETGKVVYTVHIPDATSQCTCVCFGGRDLNVLFITTASIYRDVSLEPNSGGLYAVKVPFRGRLESRFQL